MSGIFCPLSLQTLLDGNGVPIRGGQIDLFDAGTTAARSGYQDAGLTAPYPSPILTDAFGRIPAIWIGLGSYKVTLLDAAGGLLSTVDNLPGGVDPNAAAGTTTPAGPVYTGMVIFAHTDDTFDGWLALNGNTIGNPNSGATARADLDTEALFVKLWNKDPSLTVSGGRGVSATSDFTASKTIALPSYRGHVPCGVDGMGAALSGSITPASVAETNQIGATFGAETQTLSVAQLPPITPTVAIDQGVASPGLHAHAAATVSAGDHNHTLHDPQHNRGYSQSYSTGIGSGGGPGYSQSESSSTTTVGTGITIDAIGGHTHAVVIDSGGQGGSHTHTATASSFRSGQAHPNVQPSILGYFHIKL